MIFIRKVNWQRRGCNGCKEYSPEYRQGFCYIEQQKDLKVKDNKKDMENK